MAHVYDEQRRKIQSLLETAKALAHDLNENTLAYLIERAIDEAQAGFIRPQTPYSPG